MHYNTWPAIKADPNVFKNEVAKVSKAHVRILDPGQSLKL